MIALPLTDLLKKDHFHWSDEAENAFNQLKNTMTLPFWLPDFSTPFTVETNTRVREVLLK